MSLSATLSSAAHDAAHSAEGLGRHAMELGRVALVTGGEAAAEAADRAGHLARSMVGSIERPKRRRMCRMSSWVTVLLAAGAAVAAWRIYAMVNRRPDSASSPGTAASAS